MKLNRTETRRRPNPVRPAATTCLIVAVLCSPFASTGHAQPHVVGYERFHSDRPSVEGGAILFSELGCANCHGGSSVKIPRKGPNLIDLSQRIDHEWLVKFLRDPETGRKGSTMPSMLHGLKDGEIDAVIAFLGKGGEAIKFPIDRHANAERGSALYHEKGCVACHAPTADFKSPHGSSEGFNAALAIAHPDHNAKTSLEALNLFLFAPSNYRVDGRMPHIQLDKQEAMDVAAHLIDFQASDPREAKSVAAWPEAGKELGAQGKALVQGMNCAACQKG